MLDEITNNLLSFYKYMSKILNLNFNKVENLADLSWWFLIGTFLGGLFR